MSNITVSLPDGSERELADDATALDLAAAIGSGLRKAAVAAVVDGAETDLTAALHDGATVSIITAGTPEGRHVLRHSTAHVMAQAVTRLFPGAKFSIGPAIENGFYYDFELPGGATFSDDDLERIEAEMREIIKSNQPFTRSEMSMAEAKELFADQPYKVEIIERVESALQGTGTADNDDAAEVGEGGVISVYRNTDSFVDMCVGPHVPSTGKLGFFKLQRVSGAYWRGNEKGPMLQRVYGTAWESKQALAEHLHQLEEAAKRDHRKLATELDLLSFPSELGGGLAVWHPKGAIVRKLMEDYSRTRHEHGGYEFVYTPHLANGKLFEKSGHLQWYADGMYPPMEMDNGTYYMKPMNCPMHCLIFGSRQRSYRELPLRLFELGNVYRYERAGTLHGLMRIRASPRTTATSSAPRSRWPRRWPACSTSCCRCCEPSASTTSRSTCRPRTRTSTSGAMRSGMKPPRRCARRSTSHGLEYAVKEGDAAFYGPKIDIDVRDAIGRSWQLSTIQADFQLPERFDLEYVGADNGRHRPIMLHRALFGSIERFFGVLIEHYAGAFPTWLSPTQVRVLAVAEAHEPYAASVVDALRAAGARVDTSPADDGLGKRIRSAKLEKIPYVLVVGDDDVAAGTVGVNPRGGEVERGVALADFVAQFLDEVAEAETAALGA